MQRLTDDQRQDAAGRVDDAKRMARRFRAPAGMSQDELNSECFMVLVEAVATVDKNANWQAHLFMRTRVRWMDLRRKAGRLPRQMPEGDIAQAKDQTTGRLGEVLEGLAPLDSDLVRLRVAGGDWETIGKTYGCCGRTVRRRYNAVVERLREREVVG